MQSVFLFILLSLITLVFYIEKNAKYYLILSMVFYFIGLMIYEVSYPLFILHIVLVFSLYRHKPLLYKIKTSLLIFLVALITFGITIAIRVYYGFPILPVNGGLYSLTFSISGFFKSMLKDISAVIPLSYTFLDPHKIFGSYDALFYNASLPLLLCIGIGSFTLFYIISRVMLREFNINEMSKKNLIGIALLGICLIVLPLVVTSMSSRHQPMSAWGYAYLPAYISAFGGCICAILFLYYLYQKISALSNRKITVFLLIFSLIFSLTCIVTYSSNSAVVERENTDWLYPRQVVEDGMHDGLFRDIPDGSILVVNSSRHWDQPAFYRMHSGIHFSYVACPAPFLEGQTLIKEAITQSKLTGHTGDMYQYSFSAEDNVFYLDYYSKSRDDGYAILGKIDKLSISGNEITGVTTNQAKFFVSSRQFFGINQALISGQWTYPDGRHETLVLHESDMSLLSKGNAWKLFSIDTGNMLIDPLSLLITVTSKAQHQSVFMNDSEDTLLKSTPDTALFYTKFENGNFGNGMSFEPISLSENFSIEVLIKPYANQPPYASIISNHPGYNYFEGFTIQQDGGSLNDYSFIFGSGKAWEPGVRFHLNELEWNFLVTVKSEDKICAYVNGQLVASSNVTNPLKNSDMRLYIGNWDEHDRNFRGLIKEAAISKIVLNKEEITLNWERIKGMLKDD